MNEGDEADRSGGGRSVTDLLGVPVTQPGPRAPSVAQGSGSRLPRSVTGGIDEGAHPGLVVALLSAVTVAGLLLRLPSFRDSLNGDEVSTYFIVVGHSLGGVLLLVHSNQETTPPLYFVLAWFTKGLLGNQAQSIRLVSLVAGTAAIPLTFLLGRLTVGRRAGLVGATCVALSPYMIFYSTQARPYMLVLFLALLSTLALLRAIDTGRVTWWVAYAACSCAAAYTHYTVVFILIVQLVWALWTRPQARRALVVANVAVGVAYLPWLGGLREDLRAPNFIGALTPVNPATIRDINENFWIGHPITPIGSLPGTFTVTLAGAGFGPRGDRTGPQGTERHRAPRTRHRPGVSSRPRAGDPDHPVQLGQGRHPGWRFADFLVARHGTRHRDPCDETTDSLAVGGDRSDRDRIRHRRIDDDRLFRPSDGHQCGGGLHRPGRDIGRPNREFTLFCQSSLRARRLAGHCRTVGAPPGPTAWRPVSCRDGVTPVRPSSSTGVSRSTGNTPTGCRQSGSSPGPARHHLPGVAEWAGPCPVALLSEQSDKPVLQGAPR